MSILQHFQYLVFNKFSIRCRFNVPRYIYKKSCSTTLPWTGFYLFTQNNFNWEITIFVITAYITVHILYRLSYALHTNAMSFFVFLWGYEIIYINRERCVFNFNYQLIIKLIHCNTYTFFINIHSKFYNSIWQIGIVQKNVINIFIRLVVMLFLPMAFSPTLILRPSMKDSLDLTQVEKPVYGPLLSR